MGHLAPDGGARQLYSTASPSTSPSLNFPSSTTPEQIPTSLASPPLTLCSFHPPSPLPPLPSPPNPKLHLFL
ncbi:hypothetical protein HPP92_016447 [Vanilla planifolia]|uniref:Uncharacterized protein n=1 Tax=Vanilla planifolia TaxID=51239 RepID=A0A835UQ03_VANPL|nr:hypothetical protein HPP92_016447 [Vanilla planifolia]